MSATSVVVPQPTTTNVSLDGGATSSDILKSEGPAEPVADTPAVDYEPFLADKKYHKTSPPEILTLTEEQEAVYQEVLNHFSAEDYAIPELKEGDGKLTEEEKFYLVSLFHTSCRVLEHSGEIRTVLRRTNVS